MKFIQNAIITSVTAEQSILLAKEGSKGPLKQSYCFMPSHTLVSMEESSTKVPQQDRDQIRGTYTRDRM